MLYWGLRSTTSALVPLTNTCLSVLGEPLASSNTLLMFITKACLPAVLKSKISMPWMRAATAGSVRSRVLVAGVLVEVTVVFRLSASKPLTLFSGTSVNVEALILLKTVYRLSVVRMTPSAINLLTKEGSNVLAAVLSIRLLTEAKVVVLSMGAEIVFSKNPINSPRVSMLLWVIR